MTRIYKLNGRTPKDAAVHIRNFLETDEKMEVQCLLSTQDEYLIQGRATHNKVKKLIGMDKAITIKIKPIGDDYFSAEIGEGKWLDKGIALATAYFVFAPLAITSCVGLYKQKVLPDKIHRELATVFTHERTIG